MRRLPDEASAQALLARGALDADALARLAGTLADFLPRRAPDARASGAPRRCRATSRRTSPRSQPFVGDLVDRATFEEVSALQEAPLERAGDRASWPRRRRAHPRGPRRPPARARLLPARPRRRQLGSSSSTASSSTSGFAAATSPPTSAFLAMELEAAGRPDLAAGFLARFAEASDDFGLYDVIDFYLSYRAWVRGKVAAFVADRPEHVARRARPPKRDEARRHFALARAFSRRRRRRAFLLAVGGVIGSGKSTLAAALGRELAVPVVSSGSRAQGAGRDCADGARPTRASTREQPRGPTPRSFRRAGARARARARRRSSTRPSPTRAWRAAAAAARARPGARFVFVEASCADRDRSGRAWRAVGDARPSPTPPPISSTRCLARLSSRLGPAIPVALRRRHRRPAAKPRVAEELRGCGSRASLPPTGEPS